MTKKKPQKKANNSSLPSGSNNGGKQSLTEHEIQMVLLEEQEIDQLFSTISLKRKPIAKDGACLFRAFSDLYYGTQIYHDRVRKSCIEYMKEHESFFKDFIFEMDFNSYIKFMSKPSSWGSQLELESLASLYKVNIIVYGINGILTEHRGDPTLEAQDVKNQWASDISISDIIRQKKSENIEPKKRKDIRLAYLYGSHYDSVYPANEFMNTIIVQDIFYDTFMEPFKNDLFQKKIGTYMNVEYDAWLDELEKMEKKSLQKVKELLFQNEKSYDLNDAKEFPQLERNPSAIVPPSVSSSSEVAQDGSENAESSNPVEEKPQNAWLIQEKPNWASVAVKPVEVQPPQPAQDIKPQTATPSTSSATKDVTNPPPITQSHTLTVKMAVNENSQDQNASKKKTKGNQRSKKTKSSAQPTEVKPKETIPNDVQLPVLPVLNNTQHIAQQPITTPQQSPPVPQFSPVVGYPNVGQPFPPQFMGQPGVFNNMNQPPFLVMMPPPYPMPQHANNGMIMIPGNLVPPNFVPHYPMMPQGQPIMMNNVPPQTLQPILVSEPKPVSAWATPFQSSPTPTSTQTISVSPVNPQNSSAASTTATTLTSKSESSTQPTTSNKKNTKKKK